MNFSLFRLTPVLPTRSDLRGPGQQPPTTTRTRHHQPNTAQQTQDIRGPGDTQEDPNSRQASNTPLVNKEQVRDPEQNAISTTTQGAEFNGKADPFAGGIDGGIEYKTMVWWHAGMVMVAETISLGILSLPLAMATLGIIPGLILLIGLGGLASYSGYLIGEFRSAYPHIHSWADAGEVLFGKIGRETFGAAQLLFLVFIMASHILTFSVMMNTITDHGTCSVVFMVAGTILSVVLTLPRTLKHLSYYSIASFVSIIAAVLTTMVAVALSQPGRHHDPSTGEWIREVRLWPRPDLPFHTAFLAMTNMVFAYAGHAAFFSFIAELKNPRDFPKALAFLQISDVTMYVTTAVVIYYYAGDDVASPALESASPIVRKIAYGLAIPTIVIAGVVTAHVAIKYVYVRLLRGNKEDIMHQRSFKSIGLWVLLCVALWTAAWIIAEGIPVFNDLLGVTSALFASWFTFGLSGIFWLRLNFSRGSKRWWCVKSVRPWTVGRGVAFVTSAMLIIAGAVICVVGLYASVKNMGSKERNKPFSC